MVEVRVSVGWFGEEGGSEVTGLVKVDISIQEADLLSWVVTLEFNEG